MAHDNFSNELMLLGKSKPSGITSKGFFMPKIWWAILDSNQGPLACESYALLFPRISQCISLKVFIAESISSCK